MTKQGKPFTGGDSAIRDHVREETPNWSTPLHDTAPWNNWEVWTFLISLPHRYISMIGHVCDIRCIFMIWRVYDFSPGQTFKLLWIRTIKCLPVVVYVTPRGHYWHVCLNCLWNEQRWLMANTHKAFSLLFKLFPEIVTNESTKKTIISHQKSTNGGNLPFFGGIFQRHFASHSVKMCISYTCYSRPCCLKFYILTISQCYNILYEIFDVMLLYDRKTNNTSSIILTG